MPFPYLVVGLAQVLHDEEEARRGPARPQLRLLQQLPVLLFNVHFIAARRNMIQTKTR